MKSILIKLAISVALVLFWNFMYGRFMRWKSQRGGFRDWVRNPAYKKASEDYFAARAALTVPEDISESEIRAMVKRLFVREDDDFNFERLELLGQKAVPFLIESLKLSETFTQKFADSEHSMDAESPFERLCDLLSTAGAVDAADPLERFLKHHDAHFRIYAAMTLGRIGSDECISPLLMALNDENDRVRLFATMGIQHGIGDQRCSRKFLDAMFPRLLELLSRKDESDRRHVPELMLAIDVDRARPELLSDDFFTVNHPELHNIVEAFNDANQIIPHQKLLPTLTSVRPLADSYPHNYEYAALLKA